MKVVVMLNWGVGLEILRALIDFPGVQVDLVITQYAKGTKDKWRNAVYDHSVKCGIKTIKEESMTFKQLRRMIKDNDIDLLITHSFMRRIPKEVFSAPKGGSVNLHPSLLPKYKGPSPHRGVIKNREKVTGMTSHYITDEIDGGDIISQAEIPVAPEDTAESIIEKQKSIVEKVLAETITYMGNSNFKPIKQRSELTAYAERTERKGRKK